MGKYMLLLKNIEQNLKNILASFFIDLFLGQITQFVL